MPLDGVTIRLLAKELNQRLAGGRVDKINQPLRNDVVLVIRARGVNHQLLLSANPSEPRLHLTRHSFSNPPQAPMFCMLLRKHLGGAKLISVETVDLERLVILRFMTKNELGDQAEKRLICEMMGRHSNLILINENRIIIDSISHVDAGMSRVREVMPARTYVDPPAQHKLLPADILQRINNHTWLAHLDFLGGENKGTAELLLGQVAGFSPFLCAEICAAANVDERAKWNVLNDNQKQKVTAALVDLLACVTAEISSPSLYYFNEDDHIARDFHAFALFHRGTRRACADISEAMDQYYSSREEGNRVRQSRQQLTRVLEKSIAHVEKKQSIYHKDIRSASDYEDLKIKGDLILANLWQIEKGHEQVEVQNYYKQPVEPIAISLNPDRSPSWNAQDYYRRYNKNKTKYEMAQRFLAQSRDEIEYLNTLLNFVEQADTIEELKSVRSEMRQSGLVESAQKQKTKDNTFGGRKAARKRAKTTKGGQVRELDPHRYISSDGFTILAGRNNLQNDRLTLRLARKDDLWLHVSKAPGTHVIIRSEGAEIPDQTLLEAARIAAWFSRSGNQSVGGAGGQTAVDYCPISHVKKPTGSRPGMVIYNRHQTIMVTARDPEYLLPRDSDREES